MLVPYPFASADHQRKNAAWMAAAGAAVMVADAELTGERLRALVSELLGRPAAAGRHGGCQPHAAAGPTLACAWSTNWRSCSRGEGRDCERTDRPAAAGAGALHRHRRRRHERHRRRAGRARRARHRLRSQDVALHPPRRRRRRAASASGTARRTSARPRWSSSRRRFPRPTRSCAPRASGDCRCCSAPRCSRASWPCGAASPWPARTARRRPRR